MATCRNMAVAVEEVARRTAARRTISTPLGKAVARREGIMLPYLEHPSWSVGPFTIYAFGVAVAAAVWFGLSAASRRFVRVGLDATLASRAGRWTLVGGVLGAHLFSVLVYFPEKLRRDPWLLLRLWEDISSFGGILGGVAGAGSAAIAHSAVRTKYPASEGIVALLEPFIDTVVICTMTSLVIIITNFDNNILQYGVEIKEGVELTATAFDSVIPHFSIVLTIAVILFAFSTMISWSYYGMQGWVFLFGRGKVTELIYKMLFCIFIWIGAVISLGSVIDFSDAMIFAMVVPNIIGVVILTPVIRKELKRYMNAIKIKHEAIDEGLEDLNEHL